MEKITRFIQRPRENGYIQTFPFTTWSVIFTQGKEGNSYGENAMLQYLLKVFFFGLPRRSKSPSQLPEIFCQTKREVNGEFSNFALDAGFIGAGNRQHAIVEKHFMDNHPDCIGTEVPIYDNEIEGCMDIVLMRKDPFKISILDFKPNAAKEKRAGAQLMAYQKALGFQTGIAPTDIDLYYFDEINTYKVTL